MLIVISVTLLLFCFYFREPWAISVKKHVDIFYESAV